jgi:hypothetical protein
MFLISPYAITLFHAFIAELLSFFETYDAPVMHWL